MCGIFGVVEKKLDNLEKFYILQKLFNHRGPDSRGEMISINYAIGIDRLKIVGIENGEQPIWNKDENLAIVANGEIYNYSSLRSSHQNIFSNFSTKSDIEVILKLYEVFGTECFSRLSGMFAACILDEKENKLILARDPLGEKPLFYSRSKSGEIFFGSELMPIVTAMNEHFKIDLPAFSQYLKYSFVPETNCIIEGIRKVPPGGYVEIDLVELSIKEYSYTNLESILLKKQNKVEHLEDSDLLELLNSTLASEVPLAIALSAGLDSSMLLKLALQEGEEPSAIIINFPELGIWSEKSKAEAYARELGVEVDICEVTSKDVAERIQEICLALDEPLADPATVGYYFLAKTAKEKGKKVLLTGQGADELFWGYDWVTKIVKLNERRWKYFNSKVNFTSYIAFSKPNSYRKGEIFDHAISFFGLLDNFQHYLTDRRDKINGDFSVKVFAFRPQNKKFRALSSSISAEVSTYIDPNEMAMPNTFEMVSEYVRLVMLKTYLPNVGLAQTDRLFMRHSIESRAPFANSSFVNSILNDDRFTMENSYQKKQMKEVFASMFTKSQLQSKKSGFQVPLRDWLSEILNVEKITRENCATFRDGLIDERGLSILTNPLNFLGRIKTGWYELFVFEMWLRNLQKMRKTL